LHAADNEIPCSRSVSIEIAVRKTSLARKLHAFVETVFQGLGSLAWWSLSRGLWGGEARCGGQQTDCNARCGDQQADCGYRGRCNDEGSHESSPTLESTPASFTVRRFRLRSNLAAPQFERLGEFLV
jgi:hypothetical protein